MKNMVRVGQGTSSNQYQAPSMKLGRSQFRMAHNHKTTFDAGLLIPYFCAEVVPGDTFNVKLLAFARVFSPLAAPIMDDIELGIDFFYVPNRILWDNWHRFLGEHDDAGAQDTDYTIPIWRNGVVLAENLMSYLGMPVGLDSDDHDLNVLPIRAYRKIYNEWYRDQNLIDSVTEASDDGPDTWGQSCYTSAKKHDYFTSALPYLQKGDAQTVPLIGEAEVTTDVSITGSLGVRATAYSFPPGTIQLIDTDAATADLSTTTGTAGSLLYANLASADTGFTINALRESAAIQRLLEKDARGGTRPNELIKAHFGVTVPDYRVDRPEYLGGSVGYINVSPVSTTSPQLAAASPDGTDWDAGRLAGTAAGTLTAGFAKSFVEHGYVLGILRARGAVSYQQGLDRMWSRSTKYDFLWPELAHLGEQPIYNRELFITNVPATDGGIFGYQERYADYRYKKSLVTGKFDSSVSGSLDYWHLSEDFASAPALNATFIQDATPMARVTTVADEPDFIIDGRFDMRVARALPVRPEPSLTPARF